MNVFEQLLSDFHDLLLLAILFISSMQTIDRLPVPKVLKISELNMQQIFKMTTVQGYVKTVLIIKHEKLAIISNTCIGLHFIMYFTKIINPNSNCCILNNIKCQTIITKVFSSITFVLISNKTIIISSNICI